MAPACSKEEDKKTPRAQAEDDEEGPVVERRQATASVALSADTSADAVVTTLGHDRQGRAVQDESAFVETHEAGSVAF
jgi:hypothetical protein